MKAISIRLRRLEERVTPTNKFPDIEFVSAKDKSVTSRLALSPNGAYARTELRLADAIIKGAD